MLGSSLVTERLPDVCKTLHPITSTTKKKKSLPSFKLWMHIWSQGTGWTEGPMGTGDRASQMGNLLQLHQQTVEGEKKQR